MLTDKKCSKLAIAYSMLISANYMLISAHYMLVSAHYMPVTHRARSAQAVTATPCLRHHSTSASCLKVTNCMLITC